jgi:hypothetical protein
MTLVDRYLRAVRDHLPRGQQDDIINELADSLHSRMEDEAASRGRPLLETEESAILKEFGHPMTVAARYRADERSVTFGRRLIGPELFPTYMQVLAINVAITLLIAAITAVASVSIWPGITGILIPLAIQFTIVTAIFIVIDTRFVRNPDGWDPRTVTSMGPDVDVSTLDGIAQQLIGKAYPRVVPVTASILEIGLVALTLTVALAIGLPARIGPLKPGPGWVDVFVPIIAVIVLSFLGPAVNLFRPTWTRVRIAAHVLVNGATIVIGAVSLAIGSWVVLAEPATPEMTRLIEVINGFVRVSIAITIVLTAVTGALELRRLVRASRG